MKISKYVGVLVLVMFLGCVQGDAEDTGGMTVTTDSWETGGIIPAKYTCDGEDVSPSLRWGDTPNGTATIAIIMDDPDAPGGTFTHWVLFDMPGWIKWVDEGILKSEKLPLGAFQGENDFGETGYNGPCPPPGEPHIYRFKVYALDTELALGAGVSKTDLEAAIEGHIIDYGMVKGLYGR